MIYVVGPKSFLGGETCNPTERPFSGLETNKLFLTELICRRDCL